MDANQEIWQHIKEIISKDVSGTSMDTWFNTAQVYEFTAERLVILEPSSLKRSILSSRFLPNIKAALQELLSADYEVAFIEKKPEEKEKPGQGQDGDDYTFDTFVVGPSNRFAYAAAKAVAQSQPSQYNPLYIHGPSGLGKTHLLYAIRHEAGKMHPEFKVVLARGADFMNELILAIQNGRKEEFRMKYRDCDMLLIDDIQIIAGKQSTEEEIFQIFNTLFEARKTIVFTSDRPPQEMALLSDRIRSRLSMGLLADISTPDFETRAAIVLNKSQQLNMNLSMDVVNYIADNITSNVRQLEGAVKKIHAHRELMGGEVSLSNVSEILKDMYREKTAYVPTPDDIIDETAKYYGISPKDLRGKSRTREVAQARHIAMYLIRQLTNLSLQDVGRIFDRDHTTVLNSLSNVEARISREKDFNLVLKDITSNINSRDD